MSDSVRTATVPERDRFDFWCRLVSETFVPLEAWRSGDGAFRGEMRGTSLGALRFYQIVSDGHAVRRTPRLISASPGEYVKLGLQRRGRSVLAQDGREAVLSPGDFAVYDTARPYTFAFDAPHEMLILIFPRPLLGLPAQQLSRLTATALSGRHGVGALISTFLLRAAEVLDEVDARDSARLAGTVLDLLSTGLAGRLEIRPARPSGDDGVRRALLTRAVAFIEQHLGDPDLDPAGIATALHISVRYLHKLFHAEGTSVAAWVRRRRLEACGRDLRDPALANRPVSAVAARRGLPDAAHFSRLFRATFGVSPRDYRRGAVAIRLPGPELPGPELPGSELPGPEPVQPG
jgi:AraC-like DNA-binding protein